MKMGAKSAPKTTKWGQKAPPTQIRAEKVWGQKVPSKQQSDGKKCHHSNQREKRHGGGMCHQNAKVVAENATKTVK